MSCLTSTEGARLFGPTCTEVPNTTPTAWRELEAWSWTLSSSSWRSWRFGASTTTRMPAISGTLQKSNDGQNKGPNKHSKKINWCSYFNTPNVCKNKPSADRCVSAEGVAYKHGCNTKGPNQIVCNSNSCNHVLV